MFVLHPISSDTRSRLLAAGLDPDAVAALVRMAVQEDLMGGVDVTSVATIPSEQRSVATFGARKPGVVAGLAVAAAAIDAVCGDAASDFEYLVADGDRVGRGYRRGAGDRARRSCCSRPSARRSTCCATCRASPR